MAYKTCSCGAQSGPRKEICGTCGKAFPKKDSSVPSTETKPTISSPLFSSPLISSPLTASPSNKSPVAKPTTSFLDLSNSKEIPKPKDPPSPERASPPIAPVRKRKIAEDDDVDSESTCKNTNKRNCLLCNTEFESEDYRTDEYGKTYYYYKYARYCSSNCLETSDETKTSIIVDIFEFLEVTTPNTRIKLLEHLKKDIKISNVLKGIELDKKDAENYQKYINERPKINILSPQKKKLSTPKDFKEEGISMPQLKDRKIVEEPVKKTSFLDLVDE